MSKQITVRTQVTGFSFQKKGCLRRIEEINRFYTGSGASNIRVLHEKKEKSRIEMRPLLRIFRFCNPQRKHRKPSTYVQLPGGWVINADKGHIILPVINSISILNYATAIGQQVSGYPTSQIIPICCCLFFKGFPYPMVWYRLH